MEYVLVIVIVIFSFLLMNRGLILKNRPLKKGGGKSADGCEICGGDVEKCEDST